MNLQADVLSDVLELLHLSDLACSSAVSLVWHGDHQSQRRLQLSRLAAGLVESICNTEYDFKRDGLHSTSRTSAVEEQMSLHLFKLLFGRDAVMTEGGTFEVKLNKPRDVIDALPSLPVAVGSVKHNAPPLLDGPLTCWVGYVDGSVKYDPARSNLTLHVRSEVVKLSHWKQSAQKLRLHEYLDTKSL
jgi:hypothetical protein